jgi:glycosyltransferase involved in cell wall biosynthesis
MFLTGKVVFVSDHSRRVIVEERGLPSDKARVIHNGIALGAFGEPATPDSARPRIRFGTVGRLVPVKAHRILIDAFATLLQRVPEAELTIAGQGPLFGEIQARIRELGIAAHVTLAGETRDVPAMLRKCDIFVFSSISEGLPIVILEAMAAGLPIVSTRVGGVPEVAPEGQVAWYCEPGNATDLAEAMYRAATSGECASRGKTAREIACQRYGIAHTQQAYEAVYRELIEVGG